MKITLKEYARRNNRDLSTLRHKAIAGNLLTAEKVGRDWMIDENEVLTDLRYKSGKYVNSRKNNSQKVNK